MFDLVESLHLLPEKVHARDKPDEKWVCYVGVNWEKLLSVVCWEDEKFLWTSGDHMFSLVIWYIKDQRAGVNVAQGNAQPSPSKTSFPREDINFDVLCQLLVCS